MRNNLFHKQSMNKSKNKFSKNFENQNQSSNFAKVLVDSRASIEGERAGENIF